MAGLTQLELAERAGIARSSVVNYETDHSTPRLIVLRAWAHETGVSLAWLLDDDSTVTDGYLPIPGQIQLLAA